MIANRKEFYSGVVMMIGFIVVLCLFFAPLYNGHNGFAYLDNLYNSISKGSSNYLEMVQSVAESQKGFALDVTLPVSDKLPADTATSLLTSAGAQVSATDEGLHVTGDLGMILLAAVEDTKDMYNNDGDTVAGRRSMDARVSLYTWWNLLSGVEKRLTKQKHFSVAKEVSKVVKRGVEPSYNYYGIEATSIMGRLGVVIFSLVFYVVYTLWYGFAILFMFEGWGLKLEH